MGGVERSMLSCHNLAVRFVTTCLTHNLSCSLFSVVHVIIATLESRDTILLQTLILLIITAMQSAVKIGPLTFV